MNELALVFQVAINHLWQSAALTAAALLLFAAVRGMSEAMCHTLAFAALVAAAVLPAAAWLPRIAMGDAPHVAFSQALAAGVGTALRPIEAATHPASSWDVADFATLAVIVWSLGAGIGLIRLAADLIASAALVRRSAFLPLPPRFHSLLPLDLRESREAQSPMVIGFIRPSVVVPIGLFDHHGDTELQAVLGHEKAHIDRNDPLTALLQRLIVVVFWWNPLLRLLSRHIDESREMACDASAARQVGDAQVVAKALTDFVHEQHYGTAVRGLGLGGGKALFTRRIRRLLETAAHAPPHAMHRVMAVALAILIGGGIIVATPRSQAAAEPPASVESVPSTPTSPVIRPDVAQPSALSIAITRGDSDMLRRLIRAGADVKAAEARGERLLLSAVQADNTGMVEALVSAGADAGAAQARGEPVLTEAVRRGNSGIARLLMKAGASPD